VDRPLVKDEQKNFQVPDTELMTPGNVACGGCGATLAMRTALKALGESTVTVIPACCWAVIDGAWPYSSLRIANLHTAFETTAAAASGVRAGLDALGETDTTVVGWAGDGGTFDIGIQALSGAAERNEDFIYVCYDNEAYMNTGIQRSSATPYGAWTTTTPVTHFKGRPKKNMMEIMAAHRIPYAATTTVAHPDDMIRKLRKAKAIKGTKFIHILSPCPPGWKLPSHLTIDISRKAVDCKAFPIYEIEDGVTYTLNIEPKGIPISEYLGVQGRFSHLPEEQLQLMQRQVDEDWDRLIKRMAIK
jgi:pyruvate/2-oxoacid:ferredoxin oxidoreductase beta subunit